MTILLKMDRKTWAKVTEIFDIAEDWLKRGFATEAEVKLLKILIFDFKKAQIEKLLSEMLAIDQGLKSIPKE